MATKDHVLPDGYEIRVYDFGGIDAKGDDGKWHTVTSTRDGCAALADIARRAADGVKTEE